MDISRVDMLDLLQSQGIGDPMGSKHNGALKSITVSTRKSAAAHPKKITKSLGKLTRKLIDSIHKNFCDY